MGVAEEKIAYEKALQDNESLVTYVTYREILSIAYFMFSFEEFYEHVTVSTIYKNNVKRELKHLYPNYINFKNIVKKIYFGDEESHFFEKIREKYIDILKLRFTINNVLLKYNECFAEIKSYAIYSYYLLLLTNSIHKENVKLAKSIGLDLKELAPINSLSGKFEDFIRIMMNSTGNGKIINLDTLEISNGLKIIKNHISDAYLIRDIILMNN